MLRISTVPEALAELQNQTGQPWSESDLFDFASKYNIELHAATPLSAVPVIYRFVFGQGLVERFRLSAGHSPLAVLFPWQVAHLWIRGETEARHPIDHEQPGDDYKWYEEPVRVRREDVRVHERSLMRIVNVYRKLQAATGEAAAKPPPALSSRPLRQRRDLLTPVIEHAQKQCSSPADPAAVWPILCAMAERGQKPFVGQSDEGLKWTDAVDRVQFLSIKNLRDRLRNQRSKAR